MGKEIWMEYILPILHPTPKITKLVLWINPVNLNFSDFFSPDVLELDCMYITYTVCISEHHWNSRIKGMLLILDE